MLAGTLDEAPRLLEALASGVRRPLVLERMAVAREPPRVTEARGDDRPDAARGKDVQPLVVGGGEVGDRGAPREQQLRDRDLERGDPSSRVVVEHGEELVERAVMEPGAQRLVRDALAQRLARGVGVQVDEPGHHEAIASVDHVVGGACVVPADEGDDAIGKRDVRIANIVVALAVPGDRPRRLADEGGVAHLTKRRRSTLPKGSQPVSVTTLVSLNITPCSPRRRRATG